MITIKRFFICMTLWFCAGLVNAAEPRHMTWTIAGVQREALVFAPSAGGPQDKHPLIFAFHGHGGNMNGVTKWGLQNQWPGAIVVYPQGLPTPSGLDPKGRLPGWQRLGGDQGDRDLKLVDAMLATMRHDFNVDKDRVFSTGFSNGAFFTFLLWIERTDTFAGFAIAAGCLLPEQHLPTGKPMLHIAGEKDPKVTPEKVEATVVEERRADGASAVDGVNCGNKCTLFHGNKADLRLVWHPGGHEYPPRAAALSVEFFKSLGGAVAHASAAAGESAPIASASTKTAPVAETNDSTANGETARADSMDNQVIHYESHGLQLKGFVHKPSGAGPFPVYLWNHGSEKDPASGAKIAKYWVPQGFIVFAPIRSGHGDNPGAYIGDEQKKVQDAKSVAGFRQVAALHERANDDVAAAYRWIAQQAYVDPKRIVIAGGSYGGIQTLLSAERDVRDNLGVKCFVAMSPAAESWGNPNWAGRLSQAIATARAPIFLMQAQNDFNLGPSEVLGPRVDAKGFPNRHRIFPAHGDPADHNQGHAGFFSDSSAWTEDMSRYMHDCGEV